MYYYNLNVAQRDVLPQYISFSTGIQTVVVKDSCSNFTVKEKAR